MSKIKRHKKKLKKIAVITSGGDAPGMNAAIRAVVRTSLYFGLEVLGYYRGFAGILEKDFFEMDLASVGNIIHRGGTILKTARAVEFRQKRVRKQAHQALLEQGVEALVVIGGDGSFTGALRLSQEFDFPVAGVPGTIDNDLFGTDETIGFDTAINTGLQAIDKIRDTATAHDRIFLIEVMGRNSGFIGCDVGIGGGAGYIVLPELKFSLDQMAKTIERATSRGKKSTIVVVAEGQRSGEKTYSLAQKLSQKYQLQAHVCILGHVQRGGTPSARDRKLASALGALAARELIAGRCEFMAGAKGLHPNLVPLEEAIEKKKEIPKDLLLLATRVLAL